MQLHFGAAIYIEGGERIAEEVMTWNGYCKITSL